MWRDHPYSQRKKTIKRAVGCSLKATGKGRGWKSFEKVGAGVGNIGGGGILIKSGGLEILCQPCKDSKPNS